MKEQALIEAYKLRQALGDINIAMDQLKRGPNADFSLNLDGKTVWEYILYHLDRAASIIDAQAHQVESGSTPTLRIGKEEIYRSFKYDAQIS